jgi:hypothetical protein
VPDAVLNNGRRHPGVLHQARCCMTKTVEVELARSTPS